MLILMFFIEAHDHEVDGASIHVNQDELFKPYCYH